MNASAVLITKEKKYPQDVLDSLKEFDEIIVKTESPSIYQRYLLAGQARHDIIYVQDDDCLTDYRALWEHYDGRLTNAMTEHHKGYYRGAGITLVGWGCYFPKQMLNSLDKYIGRWGVDSLLLREADRAFTYLNQPHNEIIMPHVDLRQEGRMSHERTHYASMRLMLDKLRLL